MAHYSKLEPSTPSDAEWLSQPEDVEEKLLAQGQARFGKTSDWQWLKNSRRAITIHAILFLANLSVLAVFAALRWPNAQQYGHDSPLQISVLYENRPFNLKPVYLDQDTVNPDPDNNFNGPPRDELEDDWAKLMQYQNVRLQHEQLGQFEDDDSIVQLADGSGYWSTVSVFHGLHCIERLHHSLYSEHYYPNLTEKQEFTLKRHTEHCIDWLRHYVRCNADLTLIPIQWTSDSPGPTASDLGNHRCAAWDSIYDWMETHSFNPSQPGLLIHPKFGDVYDSKASEHGPALGIKPLGEGGGLLHGHGHSD